MNKLHMERAYAALGVAGSELMRSLSPTAMIAVSAYMKENGLRYSYNMEHQITRAMGGGASHLANTLFETVRNVRNFRERRRTVEKRSKIQLRWQDSADKFRAAITLRRSNATPVIKPGTSTKVLDWAESAGRYWSPTIQLSPAWNLMISRLGGDSVSKERIILSATYRFRVDDATTVYSASILDAKTRSGKEGYIARWESGDNIELKFGDTPEGAINRLRTAIMNCVMEEMRVV